MNTGGLRRAPPAVRSSNPNLVRIGTEHFATVTAAEAKRDFWLAQSDLTFVVFGGGAAGSGIDNTRPMAASEGEGAPH